MGKKKQQIDFNDIIAKAEKVSDEAKVRFNRPPYHLYFCKSAYRKGGTLYEPDGEK